MNEENRYLDIQVPAESEKKRIWIKYQLKIRGITLAAIARSYAVSRQVISRTLYMNQPRWELVIANHINMRPEQIWPERYDELGLPIPSPALTEGTQCVQSECDSSCSAE